MSSRRGNLERFAENGSSYVNRSASVRFLCLSVDTTQELCQPGGSCVNSCQPEVPSPESWGMGPIPKHNTARLFQSRLPGWDPVGFYCLMRSAINEMALSLGRVQGSTARKSSESTALGYDGDLGGAFWCTGVPSGFCREGPILKFCWSEIKGTLNPSATDSPATLIDPFGWVPFLRFHCGMLTPG